MALLVRYPEAADLLGQFRVNFRPFFLKELKITSCCCYNDKDFIEVMELMRRGKKFSPKLGTLFGPDTRQGGCQTMNK